ncbi:MAG: hypothetical protein AB1634_12070 [Thermodesulfobacteriota bacterium]
MGLLQDTEANHWVKLMFKWVYWNLLLTGTWLGPPNLQLEGKKLHMIGAK